MMQEDRYNDFDLQIRSMLQDAEEEVPSRVWDAVSGRIGREKVVGLWWRRVAAGVAAAAVVGLGVFFALDRPSVADDSSVLAEAQPSVEKFEVIEEVSAEEETLLAEGSIDRPSAVCRTVSVTEVYTSGEDSGEAFTEAEESAVQEEMPQDPVSGEAAAQERDVAAGTSETTVQDDGYRDDPFARMAYEDTHRRAGRGPVSGFVQGNVTSNERSGKGAGHLASSTSKVPTETGVDEKSVSAYGIPLSFGVGAKYRFSDKWSVSAAINYSLLSRSFTGTYTEVAANGKITKSVSADITNNIHYIGIPVNVYYDVLKSNKVSFYAFGGFGVEKGLANKYRIHSQPVINYSESVSGVQWSSALGLGLEFALNDYLGLYIDPSARYYFDCDQPRSVRTQKPFMMNLEVGLRFNI